MTRFFLAALALSLIVFVYQYSAKNNLNGTNTYSFLVNNKQDSNHLFLDSFEGNSRLVETGKPELSSSKKWWINSGAYLIFKNDIASTLQGKLPEDDTWRLLYKKNNSRDTDDGFYPQNIFRLVTQDNWRNFKQDTYFRIAKDNKSNSEYRNASNGVLHFNRYKDGDNLYYTGIRVDGYAVIKKKISGKYYTLAYNQIYPGKYDRENNPNLLPHGQWIGLRSEVMNNKTGSVDIKLYIDRGRNGNWELVAEATDDGKKYGGSPFLEAGHAGIRTDFMDVEFDDYRIEEVVESTAQ